MRNRFTVTFTSPTYAISVDVVLPTEDMDDAPNTALCILADVCGQAFADIVERQADATYTRVRVK